MVEIKTVTKPAVEEFIAKSSYYVVLPRFDEEEMQIAAMEYTLNNEKTPLPPQILPGESWRTEWREPLKTILEEELGIGTTAGNLFHIQSLLTATEVQHFILVPNFRTDTLKFIRAGLRWVTREEMHSHPSTYPFVKTLFDRMRLTNPQIFH